jgi:hypothetical protein
MKWPIMKQTFFMFVLLVALIGGLFEVKAGETNTPSPQKRMFDNWMFTTPAYNKEALRLVIQEANRVAEELKLPEELPITENNILGCFITPYAMSSHTGGTFGNVTTWHFTYYVSVDHKFSFLDRSHQETEKSGWASIYSQPISHLDTNTYQQVIDTNAFFRLSDTNAAYQLATQWLAKVSMDVKRLNRDCTVYASATTVWGKKGTINFLPLYSVYWVRGQSDYKNLKAYVKLFLPTKTLIGLRVEDTKYILRKQLQLTNLDILLSQTNAF